MNQKRVLFSEIMKNPPKELEMAIKRVCPKIEKSLPLVSKRKFIKPAIKNFCKDYSKSNAR